MSAQKYYLSSELRRELKTPLGKLYENSAVTLSLLEPFFSSAITICVGDRTVDRVNEIGLRPSLEIIDLREQRRKRNAPHSEPNQVVLLARNEPGTITSDALHALDECLGKLASRIETRIRLIVDGEEDLLVLPVVAFFPSGSLILYGQPNRGLVIVENNISRENATRILAKMGIYSLKQ